MVFWDSQQKTMAHSCFCLNGWKGIDGLRIVAYTANSFIWALC